MAGPAKSAAAVGSHVPLLLQMSIAEGRNVASQTASAVFVTLKYEEGRRRRKGRKEDRNRKGKECELRCDVHKTHDSFLPPFFLLFSLFSFLAPVTLTPFSISSISSLYIPP